MIADLLLPRPPAVPTPSGGLYVYNELMLKLIFRRTSKFFDRLFERITILVGSTPVILGSLAWCAGAYARGSRDFVSVISMVTFIFGEFILRGQNVQNSRIENKLDS